MHVSYRKPFELFVINYGERPLSKSRDAGRVYVDVTLI